MGVLNGEVDAHQPLCTSDGLITTLLGADVADEPPAAFVAVTVTRNVAPTSAWTRTYVAETAFEIVEQPAPLVPQRSQA